jgi:phage shock protein C
MTLRWVRSKDGMIFGVCKGLARTLNLPLGLLRLIWILCVLFGGLGLGLYLLLACSLPREDKVFQAQQPRLLGVCLKLSQKTDLEVGIVRFLCLCFLFASLGTTAVLYVIGYFVLPDQPDEVASRNNPSNPPSTT